MRGVLRTKRGRGKLAELNPRGFLDLPADRERYSFFEGVLEDTIEITARPVLNSNTWSFSFLSQAMVHLRSGCNLCTVHIFLLVLSGVLLGRLTYKRPSRSRTLISH